MKKNGFTLVELLVVVAIIGILSTLVIVNLGSVRLRARDAQRKSDLRQLQSALELYRADQGGYPVANASPYQINACPASFTSGTTTYMKVVPCDPEGGSYYNNGNYYYYSDGTTYTLAACIENTNDGDPQVTKTAPAGSSGCVSGYYFVLYNP